MNRQNYYFGKLVDVNEMDEFQNNIENSINLLKIIIGKGIMKGGDFTINNLSLTIDDTIAFDKDGNNILIDSQILDLSSFVPAQDKIVVSITANFTREYSQSETDDQGNPVFFKEDESSHINFVEGDISANPIPPDILDSQVLIADITLSQGQTVIIQDNISYSRVKKFNAEGKKIIDIFNHLLDNYHKKDETLLKSDNLNDVPNKAIARSNLDVYSRDSIDIIIDDAMSDKLNKSQNLNDLSNKATARTNLDVYSKSEVHSLSSQTDKIITISGTEATKYILLFRRRDNQGGGCIGRFVGNRRLTDTSANATTIIDISVKSDSNTPSIAKGSFIQNQEYISRTKGLVLGLFYVNYDSKEYVALKINDVSESSPIYDGYFGFTGRWYDLEADGLICVNGSVVTEGNAITSEGITHSNSPNKLPQLQLTQSNEYIAVWNSGYQVLQTYDKYGAYVQRPATGSLIFAYNIYLNATNQWVKINENKAASLYVWDYRDDQTISIEEHYIIPSSVTGIISLGYYILGKKENDRVTNYIEQSFNKLLLPQIIPPGGYSKWNKNCLPYDDILANLDLRKPSNFLMTFSGSGSVTNLPYIFNTNRITYAQIGLGALDETATLWIDIGEVVTGVGIVLSWGTSNKAKNVKIEISQNNSDWTEKANLVERNSSNYGYDSWVLTTSSNGASASDQMRYIKITMTNWESITAGNNRLLRVSAYSNTGTGKVFLEQRGGELYGPIDMNGNRITNHPEPINGNDLAIKGYVDTFAGKGRVWEFNIGGETGTFTAPYTGLYELFMIGAGGGGYAGAAADYAAGGRAGGGGGGAGRTIKAIVRLKVGQSYSYTIGLGGLGGVKNTTPASGFNNTPPTAGGYTRFQFYKGDANEYIYANGGGAASNQIGGSVGTLPSERCIIQDLGGDNGSSGGSGTTPYVGGAGGAGGRASIFYKTSPGGNGASTSSDATDGADAFEHGTGGGGGGGGASDGGAPYLIAGDGGDGYDGFLSIKFLGEDCCGN